MSKMFEPLKEGLEGIIDHQKGVKKLSKRLVKVPQPAKQITPRTSARSASTQD